MLRHLIFFKNLLRNFNYFDAIILVILIMFRSEKIYLPFLGRTIYFRKKTKDKETFKEIFNKNIYNIKLPIVPNFIIDAGSNTGFTSLFFKLKYPQAKIVALEIENENVKMIKKNLEKFKDIDIIQKGLFNKKAFFRIEDPYQATNSFVIKEVSPNENYDIESITIDEILMSKNIEIIDVLKIDIEGAEKDLFEKNYENWLPKVKIIMVETHDRMIPKCSYSVMKSLNEYNFILYTTTEDTLIYYNMSLISLS
jgi:FkbM family methyltransferase